MEGYHLDDCLTEQRRLNRQFYEHRRYTQGAKAARIENGQEEDDKKEAGGAEEAEDDAAETDRTTIERWYGMRGQ